MGASPLPPFWGAKALLCVVLPYGTSHAAAELLVPASPMCWPQSPGQVCPASPGRPDVNILETMGLEDTQVSAPCLGPAVPGTLGLEHSLWGPGE